MRHQEEFCTCTMLEDGWFVLYNGASKARSAAVPSCAYSHERFSKPNELIRSQFRLAGEGTRSRGERISTNHCAQLTMILLSVLHAQQNRMVSN